MKKRLIKILLLIIIFLPSYSYADEIGIEGMSLGSNLLDFYSIRQVKENDDSAVYDDIKDKSFLTSVFKNKGNNQPFTKYDRVQISYKIIGSKYKISSLSGKIYYKNNIEDCYQKRREILNDITLKLKDAKIYHDPNELHPIDPTGKTKVTSTTFSSKEYLVGVECYDWATHMKYWDALQVTISSREFNDWLRID